MHCIILYVNEFYIILVYIVLFQMVRNRKKNDRAAVPEETMKVAVDLVLSGRSIRSVSAQHNVNRQTLFRYVKRVKSSEPDSVVRFTPNYSCRQVFTVDEESALVDYILTCSKMCYGLTPPDVRRLAFQLAKKITKTTQQLGMMPKRLEKIGFMDLLKDIQI
jgi:transposase-like protein